MRFYFDLGLGKLVALPGYNGLLTSVEHKRGDAVRLEMQFSRGGVAEAIDGTLTEMIYVVKQSTEDDAVPLLLANVWTLDVASGLWVAPLNSSIQELATLLDGVQFKDLLGEFIFTTTTTGPTSSQTLQVRVWNDVWKGSEGTPLTLPSSLEWLIARLADLDVVFITRSATPPSDTSVIWFDTESATELIWYVDAWVETSSASGGESGNVIVALTWVAYGLLTAEQQNDPTKTYFIID